MMPKTHVTDDKPSFDDHLIQQAKQHIYRIHPQWAKAVISMVGTQSQWPAVLTNDGSVDYIVYDRITCIAYVEYNLWVWHTIEKRRTPPFPLYTTHK